MLSVWFEACIDRLHKACDGVRVKKIASELVDALKRGEQVCNQVCVFFFGFFFFTHFFFFWCVCSCACARLQSSTWLEASTVRSCSTTSPSRSGWFVVVVVCVGN